MAQLTIKVPDVGEGIAEVELVSWAVAEGQPVTRNQIVAEVMTDKATVEVPAPVDGVVGELTGGVGEILLVGSTLFTLETQGEGDNEAGTANPSTAADAATTGSAVPAPPEPPRGSATADPPQTAVQSTATPAPSTMPAADAPPPPQHRKRLEVIQKAPSGAPRPEGRRPTATPSVRKRARDGGIDLRTVVGSGPAGRITHEDLDGVFASANVSRSSVGQSTGLRAADDQVNDQPIVGIRRKIAEQMVASTSTIPHITYVESVDMTALEELRATLNQQRTEDKPKLTILPFLVRALVNHLPDFPQMNAHVVEPSGEGGGVTTLRTFGGVHVGIAAQTDAGLVVPVLRHAEVETIWSAAARIGELAEAARTGSADREDLTGSTITISSLGSLGGLVSTPVINKPETTIIGVNKMDTAPVWIDGAFVPRQIMNLSSSFDHRVIDGWDAAQFIQAIKRSLEQPALLFVDQP